MTPPRGAGEILKERPNLGFAVACLSDRAKAHATMPADQAEQLRLKVRERAMDLFDEWSKIAMDLSQVGVALQYQKELGQAQRLLYEFLNPELKLLPARHRKFRANRSLRDVEPSVNLWLKTMDGADLDEEDDIAAGLQGLADQGFSPIQIATTVELMVKARSQRPLAEDLIDLVTTGPEAAGINNRDTSVVVRELFAHAQQSVLVAGYAVYQGQRVFQALADRMDELPGLKVRMFLDIQRGRGDTAMAREIARRFADRFRTTQWPQQQRLPEVYFDPRALETDSQKKACLHAKCIVVDRRDLFVSSAIFTEAAQERNVEVGLLIHSSVLAERLQGHFEALLGANMLTRLF